MSTATGISLSTEAKLQIQQKWGGELSMQVQQEPTRRSSRATKPSIHLSTTGGLVSAVSSLTRPADGGGRFDKHGVGYGKKMMHLKKFFNYPILKTLILLKRGKKRFTKRI